MPIHLLPTRREFLSGLALGGVSTVLGCGGSEPPPEARETEPPSAPPKPPGFIALLSDTHINGDPLTKERNSPRFNMTKNLGDAVGDVIDQSGLPDAVVVLGDLAHKVGAAEDYAQFLKLIQPLRELGVPVHLAMGNHDDRARFLEVVKPEDPALKVVDERYVGVVDAGGIRLAILDSLDKPNQVTGHLREPQRAWLARTLDAAPELPTMVLVHHNPRSENEKATQCLWDTDELLAILRPRTQVKALMYGHSHRWELRRDGGLHFINLPAVGYVFDEKQPLGWCKLECQGGGATIAFHRIDGGPAEQDKPVSLKWRSA